MVRIRRPREVGLVAGVAICGGPGEDVVDVTLIARHCDMRASQREWGVVVVKCGARPSRRRVAGIASGRESRRYVIRIRGPIPIGLMAAIASGRKRRVIVVRVASGARDCRVSAGERERRVVVIER